MPKYNRVVVAIICGLDTRGVCIRIQITWGLSLLTQNAFLQRKKKKSRCLKNLNLCSWNSFSGKYGLQTLEDRISLKLSWVSYLECFPSSLSLSALLCKPQLHFNQLLLTSTIFEEKGWGEWMDLTYLYNESCPPSVQEDLKTSWRFTAFVAVMLAPRNCI